MLPAHNLGAGRGETLSPFFMAKEFLSYDALRGVTHYFDYDESTGTAYTLAEQDKSIIQSVKDLAAELRATGSEDAKIKQDDFMCQYAIIPAQVEMELLAKGINIHDPNCTRVLLETINRDYPHLKTSNKVHVANA